MNKATSTFARTILTASIATVLSVSSVQAAAPASAAPASAAPVNFYVLNSQIKYKEQDLVSFQSEVNVAQGRVTEVQTKLNALPADVTAKTTALSSANTALTKANSALATANTALTAANKAYAAAVANKATTKAALTTATSAVTKAQAAVTAANTGITTAKNAVTKATADLNVSRQNVTSMTSGLQQQLTPLLADLETKKANVLRIQKEIAAAKADLAKAQSQFAKGSAGSEFGLTTTGVAPTLANNAIALTGKSLSGSGLTNDKASVIDVMVYYTTGSNSAAYMKQRIQYLTDVTNQAFKDSGINAKLRLVRTEATKYTESNPNDTALNDIIQNKNGFENVTKNRQTYGADIVLLVRNNRIGQGTAGNAAIPYTRSLVLNGKFAMAVISDGWDEKNTSMTGINVFSHEVGHIFGLAHERRVDKGALVNYAYATMDDQAIANGGRPNFGTIMAYAGPKVMVFSTPLLPTQCAGLPCGFDESDTARASDQTKFVNINAPKLAAVYPTVVTAPSLQ